ATAEATDPNLVTLVRQLDLVVLRREKIVHRERGSSPLLSINDYLSARGLTVNPEKRLCALYDRGGGSARGNQRLQPRPQVIRRDSSQAANSDKNEYRDKANTLPNHRIRDGLGLRL